MTLEKKIQKEIIKQCIGCGGIEVAGAIKQINPILLKSYQIDLTYLSKNCYLRFITGDLIGFNEEDNTITLPAKELGILQNILRERCYNEWRK